MGAPHARVLLKGDRLDVEWPAAAGTAACAGLVARCRLRDGALHESDAWAPAADCDERFRARCGPPEVELTLRPLDGCVWMAAQATALAQVDVAQVIVSATPRGPGADLAWVLTNGY